MCSMDFFFFFCSSSTHYLSSLVFNTYILSSFFSYFHDRIIINFTFSKHTYVFSLLHWSIFCYQMSLSCYFIPSPTVLKFLHITHYQSTRKGLTCSKYNSSIIFNNSIILFPKWFERDNRVPFTCCCCSVRQIT